MSLDTAWDTGEQGYQPVKLSLPQPRLPSDAGLLTPTMVRRSCGRPSRRAVLYLHCLHDSLVQGELATWYLERGFHVYVADLRASRPRGRDATLAEYFGYLDAALQRARADGNKTILVSAHQAGAVIAALWCHARRGAASAEALVLADPEFGTGQAWLWRVLGGGQPSRAPAGGEGRPAELLPRAQRRIRRGLEISCPVLVISPAASGRLPVPGAGRWAGPPRLGEHVTWLRLPSATPSPEFSGRLIRKRRYDELRRWLGAYLTADVRDQLL